MQDEINPPPASEPPAASGTSARDQQLKAAFTAFKKRFKATKLDQESKLGGHRAMTGGKTSGLSGIIPPREFPADVWAELARQGRIKDCGGGFYGMV
ncbi:MAG TPA: hypothetical protein VHC70_01400 [Phycisphaerales bacterium]|nr:hypothetical protein [Phycisphaerales bacterium]